MGKIRCMICRKEFERINYSHLKTHGITREEYCNRFPGAPLVSEELKKQVSEKLKGRTKENDEGKIRAAEKMTNKVPTPTMIEGHKIQGAKMKGRTKENNEGMKAMSEKLTERTGEQCPNWKGGIAYLPYCEKFDNNFKNRVREFFNCCCYVCGKSEKDNKRKLDVHHVNYNKDTCCDDSKPLFVPLCRSCHSKTRGNREYWEEFFTISLNYLTDGKCFYSEEDNTYKNRIQ